MKIKLLISILLLVFFSCKNNQIKKTQIDKTVKFTNEIKADIYLCVNCKSPLYELANKNGSNDKDNSFTKSIQNSVSFDENFSKKTTLSCKKCDFLIGNIWNDGKENDKLRHCVTKSSLILESLNK